MGTCQNVLCVGVKAKGISNPRQLDSYLMAQAGGPGQVALARCECMSPGCWQGTSRPTHYHVVHDENGFDSNSLQMFTYHLSYT